MNRLFNILRKLFRRYPRAGEKIKAGQFVYLGDDGRVYPLRPHDNLPNFSNQLGKAPFDIEKGGSVSIKHSVGGKRLDYK